MSTGPQGGSNLKVMESEGKSMETMVISGWIPRSFDCPPRRDHSQRTYLARRIPSVTIISIDGGIIGHEAPLGTFIRCYR